MLNFKYRLCTNTGPEPVDVPVPGDVPVPNGITPSSMTKLQTSKFPDYQIVMLDRWDKIVEKMADEMRKGILVLWWLIFRKTDAPLR